MKILLISYWFSPAKVIGAKRWGEFYNLSMEDSEVEMTVLTANWQGHGLDSNVHYLGDEVEDKPFFSLNKKITFWDMLKHPSLMIRSVDASLFGTWKKHVEAWIDENNTAKFDVIISSFGPISSVLLGNYAKKVYQRPHLVDLRDLVSIQGQKSWFPIIHCMDKTIDRFIMRNVDHFMVVSPSGNKKASNFYKREVSTIYNGLSNEIEEKEVCLSIKNQSEINILYMGTLGSNRNPSQILSLLNAYAKEHKGVKIEVRFASQDNPNTFIENNTLDYIGLEWLGYLSKEALEVEKAKSHIFLLLEDLTSKGNENLTGKIFEYLNSKKPIMVSCHKDSDIVQLLAETNAGNIIKTIKDVEDFLEAERFLNVAQCNYYTIANQYRLLKELLGKYCV